MDWKSIAPEDSHTRAAADLMDRYGVDPALEGEDLLWAIAEIFGRFPYENITKLIRKHTCPPGPERFRMPDSVASEHLELGAGGTCFSLSTLFGRVLEMRGIRSYPVLARMKSVRTLHTGLVVELGKNRFLMDPGYLVHRPVLLSPGENTAQKTLTGKVELHSASDGRHFDLLTEGKWRYRLKDEPLPRKEFLELWQDSFDWVMMNNLHLSRAIEGGYLYAHGHRMRRVEGEKKKNQNIRRNQTDALRENFGIATGLTERALRFLSEERNTRKGG